MSGALTSGSASSVRVALIVGAGDGIGASLARRFSIAGFVVCVARRNSDKLAPLLGQIRGAGGTAHGFALDARKESEVIDMVRCIEDEIGALTVCVFNIGANVRFPILDTTSRVYFKVWEMACYSAFLVAREAARAMLPRGRGTVLLTGATASVRGSPGFAAFSGALAAKRALAQSMARELSPKGIHVAHVVVDGPVDGEFVRNAVPDLISKHTDEAPRLISPEDVADMFLFIHNQPRSAWTFEVDLRPWCEQW